MKIGNKRIEGRNALPFVIYRDGRKITLRVSALPLGFGHEIAKRLPAPVPSEHIVRDDRGKPLRDDDGKSITGPNYFDSDYAARANEVERLRGALGVRRMLADDPNVTFETEMPDEFGDRETARSIFGELRAAGFTMEELEGIIQAGVAAANPTEEQMEEAREAFLSEIPAAPAGPSPKTPEGASST